MTSLRHWHNRSRASVFWGDRCTSSEISNNEIVVLPEGEGWLQ